MINKIIEYFFKAGKKSLGNSTANKARKNVKDIVFFGDGDTFKLISKASSQNEGWMKSTKAMQIDGVGCVIQVTTQQNDRVAEALTFVPNVKIELLDGINKENGRKIQAQDPLKLSDGYHTFQEMYDIRMAYNAALFNQWSRDGKNKTSKSKKHNDGSSIFEGKYFIVAASTPAGLISNHYPIEFWDLFDIPAHDECIHEHDGHSTEVVISRLLDY